MQWCSRETPLNFRIKLDQETNFGFENLDIYLLLADCEVRTASYGPILFPSFYGPSAKRASHENKEGKNEDPKLAVRTEQTRLIRCLLYGFVDYSNFEKVYRELEVRTATYGPGIEQSQYAKSVSHIIKYSKHGEYQRKIIPRIHVPVGFWNG